MWIVKFGDHERHSAWATKAEALHQAKVLQEHGYIKCDRRYGVTLNNFIVYDGTVVCENGHYYS